MKVTNVFAFYCLTSNAESGERGKSWQVLKKKSAPPSMPGIVMVMKNIQRSWYAVNYVNLFLCTLKAKCQCSHCVNLNFLSFCISFWRGLSDRAVCPLILAYRVLQQSLEVSLRCVRPQCMFAFLGGRGNLHRLFVDLPPSASFSHLCSQIPGLWSLY